MKLGVALRLGRVSNLPTTWSDVLAGLVLAGGAARVAALAPALCAAISLLYVGGMYLNDAFDRDYDARERPERPIPSGAVSARTVFVLGFMMLGLGVAIVGALAFGTLQGRGAAPVLAALGLATLIVFYDAYHKQNPLSPLVMAGNRALVYLAAGWSVSEGVARPLAFGCLAMLGYLIGLTYAAKQENLREPRGFWPIGMMALAFLRPEVLPASAAKATAFALCFGWTSFSLSFLLRARRDVKRAVSYLIAGIALLDAMLVAMQGELAIALACAACFLATLCLQRFVPGT